MNVIYIIINRFFVSYCAGSNDNPTVEQFRGAYRKVIMAKELTCSSLSNCIDKLNILQIPSSKTTKTQNENSSECIVRVDANREENEPKTNANAIISIDNLLNPPSVRGPFAFDGSDITISYLAGSIEKKITCTTRINCQECQLIIQEIFQQNWKCDDSHVRTKYSQIPCKSTIAICSIANELLEIHAFKIDFNYNRLLNDILNKIEIEYTELYTETDFSHDFNHKLDMVRFIIEEFIRYRATYIAQKITLNEKQKMLRRINRKFVHFAGE